MAQSATQFLVIGNPASRRVELFQAALRWLGLPPAQVVAYRTLLAGETSLVEHVRSGSVVRLESPGQDFEVERALLELGAETEDLETGYARLAGRAVRCLRFERGRMLAPRQWYLGFCAALRLIESQLAACPSHHLLNHPADIAVMFDKRRCHTLLQAQGVPQPRSLGAINSFAELLEHMRQIGCRRVFLKLAHGSSASGVVAYQTDGRRHRAETTVEMVQAGPELRLYNSRRLQVYQDPSAIAALIDELCRHRVHVEEWFPKAGFAGRICDLRFVVIGGQARHSVLRLSRHTLTNLHLLNARGDLTAFRARLGEGVWAAAQLVCEQAMRCFPQSFYGGIDLLLAPGFRRQVVAEVNAFGDLLPGVLHENEDCYTAEVRAWQRLFAPALC